MEWLVIVRRGSWLSPAHSRSCAAACRGSAYVGQRLRRLASADRCGHLPGARHDIAAPSGPAVSLLAGRVDALHAPPSIPLCAALLGASSPTRVLNTARPRGVRRSIKARAARSCHRSAKSPVQVGPSGRSSCLASLIGTFHHGWTARRPFRADPQRVPRTVPSREQPRSPAEQRRRITPGRRITRPRARGSRVRNRRRRLRLRCGWCRRTASRSRGGGSRRRRLRGPRTWWMEALEPQGGWRG